MNFNPRTVTQYAKRYLSKFFRKELQGWGQLARFYGLFGFIGIIAIGVLILNISLMPPRTVYIATGQDGTSYKSISEKFQESFKEKGIQLELISTAGQGEGLINLKSDQSNVSASFLTAGVVTSDDYPNLASLGSIQYAPIWIFYKGDVIETEDPFKYFASKKIAIGPKDNITNKLFKDLYALTRSDFPGPGHFLELSYVEAANQLIDGKVDAVFMVDGFQSDLIQKIIKIPGVQIMNFPLADAYLKKLPYLSKLIIPKGSITLDPVYPAHDLNILASTTTLLVEKEMHPAVQWAYMTAAQEAASQINTFFERPGYFPKNLDDSFPLSPIAKRYYAQGTPILFSYLPFWLASIIEDVWAYILAFILLIIPGINLLYKIRLYPAEFLMNKMFINLRELDEAIAKAKTGQEMDKIFETIQIYESDINKNWLFEKNSRFYFNLKNALASVKRDAEEKSGQIKK